MKKDNRRKLTNTQLKNQLKLYKKIERLQMENAYLKKLNTLVQNKEKLQTK